MTSSSTSSEPSRVVLHVGLPKTATTYVQRVLWGNRDDLRAAGWGLPGSIRSDHLNAANWLRNRKLAGPTWPELAATISDDLPNWVISEEALAPCTTDEIRDAVAALEPHRVEVVVTARDLGRSLPSAWQQNVKERSAETLPELLSALSVDDDHPFWRRYGVDDVAARWASVVGAENTTLMLLSPSGGPDIWTRFAATYGWDDDLPTRTTLVRNESLSVVEAEALRLFNAALGERLPMPNIYLRAVRQGLTRDLERMRMRRESVIVPPPFRDWVDERSERTIESLRALKPTVVGSLDELRPVWPEFDHEAEPVSDEQLVATLVEALVRTVRRSDHALFPRSSARPDSS